MSEGARAEATADAGADWGYRGGDDGMSHKDRPLMPSLVPAGFDLAFEGLYRLAYRVAFRILGDRGDAEDVAQETLARAAVRWSRLEDRPEGWVTRVAANLAIDRYRRRRRPPPPMTGPVGLVDPYLGERGDLVAALRRLPRRQREALVLRYLGDLSEAQVALEMGCSVGAVKSHGARGLTSLRRHLSESTGTDGHNVWAS
jgi:RNA polymerase sigma-70 factor (sigma-E family)